MGCLYWLTLLALLATGYSILGFLKPEYWFLPWKAWIVGLISFLCIPLFGQFAVRSEGRYRVECSSCGWVGTMARHQQSGGCPRCGSDVYHELDYM